MFYQDDHRNKRKHLPDAPGSVGVKITKSNKRQLSKYCKIGQNYVPLTVKRALCCGLFSRSWVQTLTNACGCMICKYVNQKSCHAGYQEVSSCCTRGESDESIAHRDTMRHAREGSTLTLKPRADVTRSLKRGYVSVASQNQALYRVLLKSTCSFLCVFLHHCLFFGRNIQKMLF